MSLQNEFSRQNWAFQITCLLVQRLVELVDRWWDLQPGLQNSLLPLETDVLGPLNEVGHVPLGLDVLADAKGAWALFEQGVGHPLDLGLLDGQRGGCHLLSLLGLEKITLNIDPKMAFGISEPTSDAV